MPRKESLPARRRPPLALLCLTVFLVLLPLTLTKPGLPVVLKADEAAYYLGALSLWHDGDLAVEEADARRLFREYGGTDNLIVMGGGDAATVHFGVPFLYPLAAAPFAGLFGGNGLTLLNSALLAAMIWMGYAYLRRRNGDSLSLFFAASFFLLSTAFVYVFWLQAEVFTMACVMAAFFLVERRFPADGPESDDLELAAAGGAGRLALHAAGAGALVAAVAYSKPMLVVLALPLLFLFVRARSLRGLAAFAGGFLLAGLALIATAHALTEQIWPYFAPRAGISLSSPVDYLERRIEPRFEERPEVAPGRRLGRAGQELRYTMLATLVQSAPEFLVGRHGGFLVYMPFAVVAILLFLLRDRRNLFRWLVLLSAGVAAISFLALVRGQWLGGGGFVGNRYFMAVYPCFLFLVRRIDPPWLTAAGWAAAAVFLGPLLITPLGAPVVEPTLQAHVRNQPYPLLPLEWSLAPKLAGYREVALGGLVFHGRRDEIVRHGEELWVQGGKRVVIHVLSGEPRRGFVFDLRNIVSEQEVEICLQGVCRRFLFQETPALGETRRLTFEPLAGDRIPRAGRDRETYRYRLVVKTEWGEQPRWRGSGDQRFYLGAALLPLGAAAESARPGETKEVSGDEWLAVQLPSRMVAGTRTVVAVNVRNGSSFYWPDRGPSQVAVAYRWLRADGETVVRRGRRTPLPAALAAGRRVTVELPVETPPQPGRYVLVVDLAGELIKSSREARGRRSQRLQIQVTAE